MIHRFFQPARQVGRQVAAQTSQTIREDIALDFKHFHGTARLDCLDLMALAGIAKVGEDSGVWTIEIEGIVSTGKSRHSAMDQWIDLKEQLRNGSPGGRPTQDQYREAIGL